MNEKELIQKFLDNRCTKEEGIIVQQLLESDPSVLDEVLNQREWDETGDDEKEEDPELRSEIWQRVRSGTKGNLICSWFFRSAAVAAGILLVIALWFFYSRTNRLQPRESANAVLFDSVHLEHNNSGQIRRLALTDGSVVTLYPGASIRYSTNFRENRKIRLITGRAAFEVAKDRAHPFVVLSGDISTTALGTKFIVDQSEGRINVRLYEGKVVVKHIEKDTQRQPTFLSPGEQCVINTKKGGVTTIASLNNEQFQDVLRNSTLGTAKEEIVKSGLKFTNEPLSDAFEQLEEAFGKHIEYNAKEVETIYFTGEFSAEDSFDHILNILTKTNGFIVQNDQGVMNVIKPADAVATGPMKETGGVNGKRPKTPAADPESFLKYDNASLEQVFRELGKRSGVVIEFDKGDIKNKYFTGAISSKDDVGKIISIICKMNDLQLVRNAKGYGIMK